jgi:hypothetical protein
LQPLFDELHDAIYMKLDKKINQDAIEKVEKDIETDIFKESKEEFFRLWIALGSSKEVCNQLCLNFDFLVLYKRFDL